MNTACSPYGNYMWETCMEIKAWWCELCSILLHKSLLISYQEKCFVMQHDVLLQVLMISWSIFCGRSWVSFVYIFLWCVVTLKMRKRPSSNVNDEQVVRIMQEKLKVENQPTSGNNNLPQHLFKVVPRHACIWLTFDL